MDEHISDQCPFCSVDTYHLALDENGLCPTCASDPDIIEYMLSEADNRQSFNHYYHKLISEIDE